MFKFKKLKTEIQTKTTKNARSVVEGVVSAKNESAQPPRPVPTVN